jgi:hypothetical protein
MKDYDADVRNLDGVTRKFTLRGVEFTAKPTMPGDHLSALADVQSGSTTGATFTIITAAIRATLVETSRPAWDELLLTEQSVPINLRTLMAIADDLVEDATGRPPTPRSPSGTTDESDSTRSTDGSGLTAVPGSQGSSHERD